MATLINRPLKVYLPKQSGSFGIDANSGIVATENPRDPDTAILYFEGNRVDASNLKDWANRVCCAAGRAYSDYPTIATLEINESELAEHFEKVGQISPPSDPGSMRILLGRGQYAKVKSHVQGEIGLVECMDFPKYSAVFDGEFYFSFRAENDEQAATMASIIFQSGDFAGKFRPVRYLVEDLRVEFFGTDFSG